MKRTFLIGFLGGIAGFLLMVGLISLTNPASAWFSSQQEPLGNISADPTGLEVTAQFTEGERLTADSPVETAFTYQGFLKKDGQPYTGKCEVYFYLYNGGGGYVDEYYLPEVNFTNGLFSVDIDYGAGEFKGAYRAIIPSFICNGVQGTMDAQPIRAVPYALSLRPGALIEGPGVNAYGNTLTVHNESFTIGSAAIHGLSNFGPGIYASTNSPSEPALLAYSSSGPALGIFGKIKVYNAGINSNTPAFIHRVETSNICSAHTYATVIYNSKIDNNPNAILLVTYRDNFVTPPRTPLGVSYLSSDAFCGAGTAGHWMIYSLAETPVALNLNQTFNVLAVEP